MTDPITDFFTSDKIDLMQVCHTNPDFAHKLVRNPILFESILQYKDLVNVPDCFLISGYLTRNEYNKIIKVKGTIIKVGPLVYKNIGTVSVCTSCKHQIQNSAISNKKVLSCPECGGKHITTEHDLDNVTCYQTIKIQDLMTRGPLKTLEAVFEGRKFEKIIPGDSVVITGIVLLNLQNTFVKENEQLKYNYYLKGLNIEALRNKVSYNPSTLEKYISVDNKKKYLLKNFCKEIYGLNHIKLGIILCLVGSLSNENRLNSHCLLIGDPGMGKTVLLKYSTEIILPSRYINGLSTSEVGLTACAVKQDRDWALEAGALVVTDNGICCIDNFDALGTAEKSGLLEAMEQQTISIAKAGMNVKLNARGSVLAASGYKLKRNKSFDIISACNISSPLLSRFDLVFGIFNSISPQNDERIADNILSFSNDGDLDEISCIMNSIKDFDSKIYHNFNEFLIRYYHCLLKNKHHSEINTIRIVESLSRLACNHAKIEFRDSITLDDIVVAIFLFESTMKGANIINFDYERIFVDSLYYEEKKQRLIAILNVKNVQ